MDTVPKTSAFLSVIEIATPPVLVSDTAPVKSLFPVPTSPIAAPPVVTLVVPPITSVEVPLCVTADAPELAIVRLPPCVVMLPFMVTPFTAFKTTLRLLLILAVMLLLRVIESAAFKVKVADVDTALVIKISLCSRIVPV